MIFAYLMNFGLSCQSCYLFAFLSWLAIYLICVGSLNLVVSASVEIRRVTLSLS